MGLKESGLRGSLRNVSVGIDAIPDSEDLHYGWLMDEGTGSTFTDYAQDEEASLSGGTWIDGDWPGNWAIEFDGAGDYATIENIPIDTDEPLTLEISFRAYDLTRDEHQTIINRGGSFTTNTVYDFRIFPEGPIQVSAGESLDISNYVTEGQKSLLHIVHSGPSSSEIDVYVDGDLVGSIDAGDATSDHDRIAWSTNDTDDIRRHFDGDIGHTFEFNYELSGSEISDRWANMPFV